MQNKQYLFGNGNPDEGQKQKLAFNSKFFEQKLRQITHSSKFVLAG